MEKFPGDFLKQLGGKRMKFRRKCVENPPGRASRNVIRPIPSILSSLLSLIFLFRLAGLFSLFTLIGLPFLSLLLTGQCLLPLLLLPDSFLFLPNWSLLFSSSHPSHPFLSSLNLGHPNGTPDFIKEIPYFLKVIKLLKLQTLISPSLKLQITNRLRPRVRSDEYCEDMPRKQVLHVMISDPHKSKHTPQMAFSKIHLKKL